MEALIENLETDIPQAFEGEQYEQEQERIQREGASPDGREQREQV